MSEYEEDESEEKKIDEIHTAAQRMAGSKNFGQIWRLTRRHTNRQNCLRHKPYGSQAEPRLGSGVEVECGDDWCQLAGVSSTPHSHFHAILSVSAQVETSVR